MDQTQIILALCGLASALACIRALCKYLRQKQALELQFAALFGGVAVWVVIVLISKIPIK